MIEQVERYLPGKAAIRLYDSSGFTVAPSATVDLDFDSTSYNKKFGYNAATGEITVNQSGRRLYQIFGFLRFGEEVSGASKTLNVYINGAQAARVDTHTNDSASSNAYTRAISDVLELFEGDVVKFRYSNGGAGASTIVGGDQLTAIGLIEC